jgi:chromosome segregation ATPase
MRVCISLPIMFFLGCSTASYKRWEDTDRRVVELSKMTETLERRVDDLSKSISLLVNDGNFIHNELDDMRDNDKDTEQKIEEVILVIRNLDEQIRNLGINFKAMGESLNKEIDGLRRNIDDVKKAEIELSNRLELIKLEVKGKGEPSVPLNNLPPNSYN